MKLDVGENIKKIRKERNITQEQLAEKLGVTFQSVSRWENGVCYPDMELLPEIANVFNVTTDMLLRTDDLKNFRQYQKLTKDFDSACANVDVDRIMEILREIRSDHIPRLNYWFFEALSNREIYIHCEVLNEVKSFMKHLIDNSKESHIVEASQRVMNMLAGDEISIYSTTDPSRRDPDKREIKRRLEVYNQVLAAISGDWRYRTVNFPIPQYHLWAVRTKLEFLNAFCYQKPRPQHFVSGNGRPDIFFAIRIWLGVCYACYLSVLFDHDRAFEILEDSISLLEKVMALPEGTELTSTSPALDGMTAKVKSFSCYYRNECYHARGVDVSKGHDVIAPIYVLHALTDYNGWQWFNPIRNDPRYQKYIKRVEALVEIKEIEK